MRTIYTSLLTPLGELHLAQSPAGISGIALGSREKFLKNLRERFGESPHLDHSGLADLAGVFESYFQGRGIDFNLSVDLTGFTDYQRRVLLETKKIPYGRVKTYAEVASLTGNGRAARAVGQVLAKNPLLIIIPCHRVVASNGDLRGFAYGVKLKERLLRIEGAWPL